MPDYEDMILARQEIIEIAEDDDIYESLLSGGYFEEDEDLDLSIFDKVLTIPRLPNLISSILAAVNLQLLSYYVAIEKGCDIDKPRNLAKSVTVE